MDNHERTDARHWGQALSLGREGRAGAPHDGMTGRGAGPFAEGRNHFFTDPVLSAVADKYGKSVAQVALRFLIQRGIVVIPQSTLRERMAEKFAVFDFSLSADDMATIETLDKKESLFFSHYDPSFIEMLIKL